jgi:N-acetylmuramoyl-L-alanine amidase
LHGNDRRLKPDIVQHPLSYVERLEKRCAHDIRLVVIHCTELPGLADARDWGEKIVHLESQTGNSGHYYIDRDGSTQQWVPLDRIAHHVRSFNQHSLGIELVNTGRYPDWFHSGKQQMTEAYPDIQIHALSNLLDYLANTLPRLETIAAHADLDNAVVPASDRDGTTVRRKLDPGPLFPWDDILKQTALRRVMTEEL